MAIKLLGSLTTFEEGASVERHTVKVGLGGSHLNLTRQSPILRDLSSGGADERESRESVSDHLY